MALNNVLNQSEIDTLLKASEQEGAVNIPEQNIKKYEFAAEDKIIRGKMPTLEIINEKFILDIKNICYHFFSKDCEVTAAEISNKKYNELIYEFDNPSIIQHFNMSPLKGSGLILIPRELIYYAVDCYFGGTGQGVEDIEVHNFSSSEKNLAKQILADFLEAYANNISSIARVSSSLADLNTNPAFVNLYSKTEPFLVNSFNIKNKHIDKNFYIAFPTNMIMPLKESFMMKVQNSNDEMASQWENILREDILDAPVSLSCQLAKVDLKLKDIMSFKAGDIIPFEMPEQVVVAVEYHPIYVCKFGASKDKYALKIVNMLRNN